MKKQKNHDRNHNMKHTTDEMYNDMGEHKMMMDKNGEFVPSKSKKKKKAKSVKNGNRR